MLTVLAEAPISTRYGIFSETLFQSGGKEVIALRMGEVERQEDVLLRVHSHCITGHVFSGTECDCVLQMEFAQALIASRAQGLIVWLDHEGKANGHRAKMLSSEHKRSGCTQEEAYVRAGYPADNREYAAAAAVVGHFRVLSVALVTNNPRKRAALEHLGVSVTSVVHTPAIFDPPWAQRIEGKSSSADTA